MPPKVRKEHKCNHHTGSRWHNYHFSGKLIMCSVIFGFLLILIGGIVMAIGIDQEEDTKSDNYEDIERKPPMTFVGPVIMGIGGFAVVVGVFMCLVETRVFRRRNADSNPLIVNESGESSAKSSDVTEPTAIASTSRHHDRHRDETRKKSPYSRRSRKGMKKSHSSKERGYKETSSPNSESSAPISVNGLKHHLSTSDKFLTPPNTFSQENMQLSVNAHNADNSLMKSFTSSGMSWNASNDFQTPAASINENSLSLESSLEEGEMQTSLSNVSTPVALSLKTPNHHEFLTPQNSNSGILASSSTNIPNQPEDIESRDLPYSLEHIPAESNEATAKAGVVDISPQVITINAENKHIFSKPLLGNETEKDTELETEIALHRAEVAEGSNDEFKLNKQCDKASNDEIRSDVLTNNEKENCLKKHESTNINLHTGDQLSVVTNNISACSGTDDKLNNLGSDIAINENSSSRDVEKTKEEVGTTLHSGNNSINITVNPLSTTSLDSEAIKESKGNSSADKTVSKSDNFPPESSELSQKNDVYSETILSDLSTIVPKITSNDIDDVKMKVIRGKIPEETTSEPNNCHSEVSKFDN